MSPAGHNIAGRNSCCRLCRETMKSPADGMNLIECDGICDMVMDVYDLDVRRYDGCPTSICTPCYLKMVNNYNLQVRIMCMKKCFRLNQTFLQSQTNAAEAVSGQSTDSVHVSNETVTTVHHGDQTSTLTRQQGGSKRTANRLVSANAQQITSAPKNTSNHSAMKASTGLSSASNRLRYLAPLLTDFRKSDLYMEALFPLEVSLSRDEVIPLVYLCDNCYKKFETLESYDKHRSVECAPGCRYCLLPLNDKHSCPYESRYADIKFQVLGNRKYCSDATTSQKERRSSTLLGDMEHDSRPAKVRKLSDHSTIAQSPTSSTSRSRRKSTHHRRDDRNSLSVDRVHSSVCWNSSDEDIPLQEHSARREAGKRLKKKKS